MTGKRILIVEDDGILALFLADLLKRRGYAVKELAASGEAAVELVLNDGTDLVLMDIQLAGKMTGMEAAAQILGQVDIPILYMTSYSQNSVFEKARTTAPYGYLVKPVAERELLAMIETALDKHALAQKLRESEARFRAIADSAPVLIWTVDAQARCTYVNKTWLELTGCSFEQELGAGWLGGLHADDRRLWNEIFQAAAAEKRDFRLECRLRQANGSYAWVLFQGSPRFTEDGEFFGFIGSGLDVSDRRDIERQLQVSRDFALKVMHSLGQGLTITDAQGNFEYVNPAYASLIGCSPAELIGKHPADVTAPLSKAEIRRQQAERAEGKTSTYESHLLRADQSQVPVVITAVPRAQSGPYQGAIAVITDLTEQKQAEQTISDLAARFQTLMQTSKDGIHLLDEQGNVVEVNEAFCQMLGYTRDEALKLNLKDWECHFVGQALDEAMERVFAEGGMFETRHRRKDGLERDVEINSTSLVLNGQRFLYASARDITERKQAEKELRQIREALQETNQKLEEALGREQELARMDAQTSVFNKRYVIELADQVFERARRYWRPLAVLMFDIDLFKQVNDRCGHLYGDQALSEVSLAVRGHLRAADVMGRFGGDEFIIFLPETSASQAAALAERMRRSVGELFFTNGRHPFKITLSIGIASLSEQDQTLESLVRRADIGLYQAKQTGRDRVVIV